MEKKNVVSWSGGKDSTAMLFMMINNRIRIDEIVCCDTTVEFPGMYIHQKEVAEVLRNLGLTVTFLKPEHDFEYFMFEYVRKRGTRVGQKGYGWANPNYVWCRRELKLSVIDKYLDGKYGKGNYLSYIGIAFDEYSRYNANAVLENKVYPLINWGVTELQALRYCYNLGFSFDGLYERFYRVSCWCCPLQSIKDLYVLYTYYPDLWAKMVLYDSMQTSRFRKDYSIPELNDMFSKLSVAAKSMPEIK